MVTLYTYLCFHRPPPDKIQDRTETAMKKILLLFLLIPAASPLYAADDDIYYASCNIRVLRAFGQSEISWKNWLAASVEIPAGTRVLMENGSVLVVGNKKYDMPAEPQEKYIQKNPLDISELPPEFKEAIKNAEPVKGMTKEQVFMTMCAPAYLMRGSMKVDVQKTQQLSLGEMKQYEVWVYQRKRLGKKFVVEFNEAGLAEKIYWKIL